MQPVQIQAVLFDAAGTLIHLREPLGLVYSRVAQRHAITLDPTTTENAFRHAWKSMPPMGSPLGPHGDRSEKHWWRTIVNQVLDQLPAAATADADRAAYFEDLFASYARPDAWAVFPEAPAVLESLAGTGRRLFVLSNFDVRLLPVLDGLGLSHHFEQIFYSGAIGHAKPSPAIFAHALNHIGLPAAHCLHVGDDPYADWQGARNAGLAAIELDRPKNDLHSVLEHLNHPDFSD